MGTQHGLLMKSIEYQTLRRENIWNAFFLAEIKVRRQSSVMILIQMDILEGRKESKSEIRSGAAAAATLL